METQELYFDLPDELIAQYPSADRGADRLLCIDRHTGKYRDCMFSQIAELIPENSLLVLNNSKVRKARVFSESENGGRVELLFLSPNPDGSWKVITNRRKRRKTGEKLSAGNTVFTLTALNSDDTATVMPDTEINEDFFYTTGHVPLPPYIKREDEFSDEKRYQTIYAKTLGSVASPTSGLHYTKEILDSINKRGIEITELTLHVGMGTFMPLHSQTLEEHHMHTEQYEISENAAEKINRAYREGRNIIASGTTSMRTLESAFDSENRMIKAGKSTTDIFIMPGYKFKCTSQLITNFHTPQSTLLALVAAFSSLDIVKNAYSHAIREKYRFFSYGDATYFM